MSRRRCKVQRGEATVVGLVHVSAVVDQLINDSILPIVAGNVKCCVSIDIDFINLQSTQQGQLKSLEPIYSIRHKRPNGSGERKEISTYQCNYSELTCSPAGYPESACILNPLPSWGKRIKIEYDSPLQNIAQGY